jgi:hypothetical protein
VQVPMEEVLIREQVLVLEEEEVVVVCRPAAL